MRRCGNAGAYKNSAIWGAECLRVVLARGQGRVVAGRRAAKSILTLCHAIGLHVVSCTVAALRLTANSNSI